MALDYSILHYFKSCSTAVTDSRQAVSGSLYFALKGAKVDGHDFIRQAADNGAKAAVVVQSFNNDACGLKLFKVECPLNTLQEMARAKHAQISPIVIGVTGSVGKTTTKEFIAHLLSAKFKVGKTPGNSNSQVGIPLTILNSLKGDEDVVVFEMGMTHPGQIQRLTEIAPPDIAVITSVGLVHAANFSSLEEIAKSKGEILSHPKTRLAVLNHAIGHFPFRTMKTLYYGPEDHPCARGIPSHLKENLGAALLLARHFKIPESDLNEKVGELTPFERRFEQLIRNDILIVNDAYNASEPSVTAALKNLPQVKGKRIGVLGEMLELGSFSKESHERIGELALKYLDEVYLIGAGCEPILHQFLQAGKKAELLPDKKSLFAAVKPRLTRGDLLFLKGSRHWELWTLIEELT